MGGGPAVAAAAYLEGSIITGSMRASPFVTMIEIRNPSTTSNPQPQSDQKISARREESRLRPKVERFFLKTKHSTSWDDVIGNEAARTALVEAIEHPVKHRELFAAYGMRPSKGVLLYGPPGCGKTMFGKAAAAALAALHETSAGESTMMHIKGPEIQSPYVGVTEEMIRDVFGYARAYKALHGFPMVVFIDEADAILPSRDGNGSRRALPWEESQVATFLTEMDGLEDSGALVILATNRPNAIDSAVLRDGRCDRKIKVERPRRDAARKIMANALGSVPWKSEPNDEDVLQDAVDLIFSPEHILTSFRHSRGMLHLTLADIVNGAMLVGLVEQAKAIAFRRDLAEGAFARGLTAADLREAVQSVLRQNKGLNHFEALWELCERAGVGLDDLEPARVAKPALSPEEIAALL